MGRARLVYVKRLLTAAIALIATPASAQLWIMQELARESRTLVPGADAAHTPQREDAPNPVIAPMPFANPAFGLGIGAAVVGHQFDADGGEQLTGAAGVFGSDDSWGVTFFHDKAAPGRTTALSAVVGYTDALLTYYGDDKSEIDAGYSVGMRTKTFAADANWQRQFFKKGFLSKLRFGVRGFFLSHDASPEDPAELPAGFVPGLDIRRSNLAMLGAAFSIDSRKSRFWPEKGVLMQGSLMWGMDWLGSDFDHHKLQVAGTAYFTVAPETVVAFRKTICNTTSDAPYYDKCEYGENGDLRGYEPGKYRDGTSWTLHGDLRHRLHPDLVLVGFGGIGGISKDSKSLWKHSKVLSSAGFGARYMVLPRQNLLLRGDIAFGKDGPAFYMGLGQAF